MRMAILASADSWYFSDLRRAAAARFEVVPVTFNHLASAIDHRSVRIKSGECNLLEFEAILVRTMPPGSLEQVVFRMDLLAGLQSKGCTVVNSPRAIEVAVDKYLASLRLAESGLRVPHTFSCQTVEQAMTAFKELGGRVVVKPLFGSEGQGITRLDDEALALRAFKMLTHLGAVVYLQEFIPHHGYDLRLLVVGQRIFGIQRHNSRDWRTNISRGATAQPLEITDELTDMARQATTAIGASVAGVDILPGKDGHLYALEVNAVPGWKSLAEALNLDIASVVLEHIGELVR